MARISMDRRWFLTALGTGVGTGVALATPALAGQGAAFRLGLTPVFLDNDALVIDHLKAAFSDAMGTPVELIQRRTYQDITASILEGSVDAAWICGYPFLQHRDNLVLLGVPVWRGRPFYQSYLIARTDDAAQGLGDLRGAIHAFSDPDSNSGYFVTASDLAHMGDTPERFFSRSVFTYGHRNVVRAVAEGLTRSGSVDGYVWETLALVDPTLTRRTRVVSKSEWLGFPPFAALAERAEDPEIRRFRTALRSLDHTPAGRAALRLLYLDRIGEGDVTLYDGVATRIAALAER